MQRHAKGTGYHHNIATLTPGILGNQVCSFDVRRTKPHRYRRDKENTFRMHISFAFHTRRSRPSSHLCPRIPRRLPAICLLHDIHGWGEGRRCPILQFPSSARPNGEDDRALPSIFRVLSTSSRELNSGIAIFIRPGTNVSYRCSSTRCMDPRLVW